MNSERMEEYEILEETPAKQEKKVKTQKLIVSLNFTM